MRNEKPMSDKQEARIRTMDQWFVVLLLDEVDRLRGENETLNEDGVAERNAIRVQLSEAAAACEDAQSRYEGTARALELSEDIRQEQAKRVKIAERALALQVRLRQEEGAPEKCSCGWTLTPACPRCDGGGR